MYKGANIEVTTEIGCPLACLYCPQDTLTRRYRGDGYTGKRSMTLESFRSMLKKIPKQVQILFSGYVEPWTNKDCTEMILYTLEQGYKISVFTTLQGLNPVEAKAVLDEFRKREDQVNIICIHLPDKDMFMRGWLDTDDYWQVLDLFFSFFIEKGGLSNKFQAMTMDKQGIPHDKILQKYGLRLNGFVGWDRAGSLNTDKNKVDDSVMQKTVRNEFANGCGATPSDYYNHQVLLPNGDIQICCMDYGLKNKLGNLNELDRWEDVFNTPEYKRVDELSKKTEYTDELICKSCNLACQI
jgi:radical SAM protein with 4Fe4S-binding SPASM domain